ncbi:MAG TPA: DoxX family protein [Xanthomonadales bacterium]
MSVIRIYDDLTARLRVSGEYIWPLLLRLFMSWEFWESGVAKLRGENWFEQIPWADWQKGFPFPFDLVSTNLNWFLATWSELVFALMLLLGLFTRFTAISLVVVTMVATAAVHWPAEWSSLANLWSGYVITSSGDGNFKLPLLFVVMLLPLVFNGAGKISLDHLLIRLSGRSGQLERRIGGLQATGLGLLILGLASIWLEPVWGTPLLIASALAILIPAIRGKGF